ncbi:hypothetical protein Tco_1028218 [Tanacetum coccineum]|uniref:Reverse transcriptase zinc-binding domain-containing protein n=1 Tax=Tanacetum coccineum TaxID=301880 RepID=A0ABQ5G260_9ASTR
MPCNKSIKSITRRIVLAACVYFVWNERNKRLFSGDKRESKDLLAVIINNVRLKFSSLTVKKTTQVEVASKRWQGVRMKDKQMAMYLGIECSFCESYLGIGISVVEEDIASLELNCFLVND